MHPKNLQTPVAGVEQLNVSWWPVQFIPARSSWDSGVVGWWEEPGRSQQGSPKAAGWAGCGFWYMGVQEMVAAQPLCFANPHLSTCRWAWVGTGSREEEINGGVVVLPCGSHRGVSGCSVSPPQLSPPLFSPSLLQPGLVLAPSGTPQGAGSHRWALGGSLER